MNDELAAIGPEAVTPQVGPRLTVSERAVLRCVDLGATNCDEIQQMTGAAVWWVQMNVWELVNRGYLVSDNAGKGLRRHGS